MEIVLYIGLALFFIFYSIQLTYFILSTVLSKKDTVIRKDLMQQKMSILVPAYNEEMVLRSCLEAFQSLDYDNYELIIINDGSTDRSMLLLDELLSLNECVLFRKNELSYQHLINTYISKKYPNIKVIDKENGGKADSLNAGADHSSGDIVITLDADSILHADALTHINEAMQDPKVLAGGGMVHVGQMFESGIPSFKKNGLVRYQLSDYMLSFYIRRFLQSRFGLVSVVSGAFGVFRTYALFEVGGYKNTVGEDMEITLNFQKLINCKYRDGKLIFIPKAQCYTEVPVDFKNLSKQRIRWQKGFIDSLRMYHRTKFKDLGTKLVLFILFDSILPGVIGIITTLLLIYCIFSQNLYGLTLILLGLTATLQVTLRLSSYFISTGYGHRYKKTDYLKIFLFSFLELPTYRLLDSYFFLYGTIAYVLQKKHVWDKVERTGVLTTEETSGYVEKHTPS